jgi:hypothetical protein
MNRLAAGTAVFQSFANTPALGERGTNSPIFGRKRQDKPKPGCFFIPYGLMQPLFSSQYGHEIRQKFT